MNSKLLLIGVAALTVGGAIAFATLKKDNWPGCCNADAFTTYAKKNASSWSDYQAMVVRYTKETIRSESNNPLRGHNDEDLQNILNFIFGETLSQLKGQCSSVKEYLSYDGGTSADYQKDLQLQKSCATATAKSIMMGQGLLPTCLEKLGLKK